MDARGMQQWNKGPRLKGAATSKKQKDIHQYLQECSCAGDHEVKSQAFSQDSKNE
jgi:hypothetical protein